jgi:hypothetical protein
LEHLRDHVLTRPESYYWHLIVPQFRGLFDPDDVNQLARQLFAQPQPEQAQKLYDGYCDAISEATRDAIGKGWYWAEQRPDKPMTWHAIGRMGVYVVLDRFVVRTAHIRAYSAPPDRSGEKHRSRHPLPRTSTHGRKDKRSQPTCTPEDTDPARYALFLKSWDELVRSAFGDACLHRRTVSGIGRMEYWRNHRPSYHEWAQAQDPAASEAGPAPSEGDQSHDNPA